LVGVFDDQHHLFKQGYVEFCAGTLFVGATDGVTKAQDVDGELFGMERFVATAVANRGLVEGEIVQSIVDATLAFSTGKQRDDIAIAAVRFL
jgi:sigma-B regulation protein RsbU (phosphoserine phosphatase)